MAEGILLEIAIGPIMADNLLMTATGFVGLMLVYSAFLVEHFKKYSRNTYIYNGLSLVGSSLLVAYSIYLNSLVFIALNSLFALTALYFIGKKIAGEKK